MADDAAVAARQQESIAALEQGRLPIAAQERIEELREGQAAWTSDLSVAELAAITHAGFEPVGMVMGSSVYYIGAQWGYVNVYGNAGGGHVRTYPCPHGYGFYGMGAGADHRYGYNWEHSFYESGVVACRDAALMRILHEASDLNAHGVVGVRFIRRHLEGVGNSMEITMIGTAIRRAGQPPLRTPFMSHLDGVSFGKLLHGGYVPVAFVVGIGVMEIDPGCQTEWQLRSWSNARVDQISDGLEDARQLGINRLEAEVARGDAVGAVGVDVEFTTHELMGESMLVELYLTGTAVRRYAKDPLDETPLPIMRLR